MDRGQPVVDADESKLTIQEGEPDWCGSINRRELKELTLRLPLADPERLSHAAAFLHECRQRHQRERLSEQEQLKVEHAGDWIRRGKGTAAVYRPPDRNDGNRDERQAQTPHTE